MAFQTGTQVRPELGRADVSGFANAGMMTGQALASIGAQIGGAISAKKEKKKEAELSKAAAGLVFKFAQANPDQAAQLGIESLDDAQTAVGVLGATNTFKMLMGDMGESLKPVSVGTLSAAETEAKAQGYEFNPETGKYEKEVRGEGAGFLGTLGNILSPGAPFGETYTREMSPEMMQGISGMEQSQAIRAAEERKRQKEGSGDPMGILD